MDLGYDFYLICFQNNSNYLKVLHEGPWFIGQNFLTIRRWEPLFNAYTAVCSQTAIQARLPELPAEFYDSILLKRIGKKLGIVLKVDDHANDAVRGQYARICVQVNIDKSLKQVLGTMM